MQRGVPGLDIGRTLGQGGFGTVHAARDEDHGRDVAVKILNISTDEAARRRFDRERRAMGSLSSHPNIVTVFTSGYTDDERPYIVMELVEGGTLGDRLASGPMSWAEVRTIGLGLIDAVMEGHRAGVIHRDIKPANVLLTTSGQAKLTDFGIAAVASDDSQRVTVSATPAYAAPEILQGRDADERSDMYSLAATLFACLNGGQPYGDSGDGMLGVLSKIVNDPVPELEGGSAVPATAIAALRSAMAKDANDRPSDMLAFRQAFDGETAVAGNVAPAPTFRGQAGPEIRSADPIGLQPADQDPVTGGVNRRLIGIGLLGLAAVIAIAVFFIRNNSEMLVAVPEVAGSSVPDAVAEVREAGLAIEPVGAVCDSAVVRGSSPAGGSEVASSTSIVLDVDACIVPDFIGMRLDDAVELILTIDGLSIGWPNYCDDVVLSQVPEAGTAVAFGTNIDIELTPCT